MKAQSHMKAQTWTKGGSAVKNEYKRSDLKSHDVKGGQSNGAIKYNKNDSNAVKY
jgi:hypothetical protein